MVPISGINDDEILSFAKLTFENDYHIRFIEFMPATCSGIWKKEKCITSGDILKKLSGLGELEQLEFRGMGPSRNYRIKGARGVIGVISPISDHFCGFCNRLRLTADGKIRPCLFANKKIDIKGPMRQGADDKKIEALLKKAIDVKPQRHKLNESRSSLDLIKTMSKIGG
jgi:cyclic pyranopterin phosphate synthase